MKKCLQFQAVSATICFRKVVDKMSDKNLNPEEMSEDLGPMFITLTSEDGEEIELEYVDTIEYKGEVYMAFFPTIPDDVDPESVEDDEEYGMIIMRVVEVDGEEQLVTLDSEEEAEEVYQQFMEALFEEDE